MIDDRNLTELGNSMISKTMEVTNSLLIALIDGLNDICKDAKSKGVLGDFKNHVAMGRSLNGELLDRNRVKEFERIAQNSSMEYFIIPQKSKPDVVTVVYKDSDCDTMKLVAQELIKDGIPLIEDMEMNVEEFYKSLGNNHLDETTGIKDIESLRIFRVGANEAKLPFAVRRTEYGEYVILTATKDFGVLCEVPGYLGLTTTHVDDKMTLKEVKGIAKERNDAGSTKEKILTR